jgi:hypothetical protein
MVNYFKDNFAVGTTYKILNEIISLRSLGHEVYYSAYINEKEVGIFDNSDTLITSSSVFGGTFFLKRFFRFTQLLNISKKFLEFNNFDYFWFRINFFSNSLLNLLESLKKKRTKIILETLSYYPNMKFKLFNSTFLYALIYYSFVLNKSKLKRYIDLTLIEGNFPDFFGIPTFEFGMGVNPLNYTKHIYLGSTQELKMIMVGHNAPYHGTLRLLKSINHYYKNPKVFNSFKISLILVGKSNKKIKAYIAKNKLENYIKIHGPVHGYNLDNLFSQSNIGVGPLAQYITGKKDSGLKTREYCARGIPFIYSGFDKNMEHINSFAYNVPNDNSLLNFQSILNFYRKFNINKEKNQSYVYNYVLEKFSWNGIVMQVINRIR